MQLVVATNCHCVRDSLSQIHTSKVASGTITATLKDTVRYNLRPRNMVVQAAGAAADMMVPAAGAAAGAAAGEAAGAAAGAAAAVAGPIAPAVVQQVVAGAGMAQAVPVQKWCTKWRVPFFQINSFHTQSCCIMGEHCRKDIYSAWHC